MNLDNQKIFATVVLEIIGKPAEHLKETLEGMIKKMKEEKKFQVVDSKIHDPTEMEDHKGFFTTFAEIDVETDDVQQIIGIVFKYMPAHIEIVSPENLKVTNTGLNETLNELTRRLHAYDQVTRVIQNEKEILEKQLKESKK